MKGINMESNVLILIVAFLLTVTILGILLDRYLRQEQKKVIPENQYNAAWAEYYTRKARQVHTPTTCSLVVFRLLIFYSTFVGGIALSGLVEAVIQGDSALEISRSVLSLVIASPFILLVFPIGIDALFMPNSQGGVVGYILYFIICGYGIFAKDRRSFIIIYLIFITLLIVNIAGCSRVSIPDL
jgi:hypothetical protein